VTESLTILDGPFSLEEDPWPTEAAVVGNDDPNNLAPKRRVLANYWSPDSRYLLWLSVPEKDDIIAASGGAAQIFWELKDTMNGRTYQFEPHGMVLCLAVWCCVVQCGAVWCSVVQCVVVWCNLVLCGAVWCSVVQCGAVWNRVV